MTHSAEIRRLLDEAHRLDQVARQRRREAGALLAAVRSRTPAVLWDAEARRLGLDPRTAALLIEMAAGGREAK